MKRIRHLIEFATLRLAAFGLGLLPLPLVYFLTRLLALLVHSLFRIRRQVVMDNLDLALGRELPPDQLKEICRSTYYHIGMTFVEMLLLPKLLPRITAMVELPDTGPLRTHTDQGQGVVVVSGHFGSWELTVPACAAAGIRESTVIAAHQSNPYIDRMIIENRKKLGMNVVTTTDSSVKLLVRALKKGQAIGLISDQNAGETGVFVDFFGHPASTPAGTAQMVLKYRAPLFLMCLVRTRPGHYRGTLRQIPVLADDTVASLTQRYTTALEEVIRAHPEQYLWMHRRWKTRPSEQSNKVALRHRS